MKTLILLIFILIEISFAQQKYMIYFSDKGTGNRILYKGSAEYISALSELSEKSIQRREKKLGTDLISFEDIPVKKEYVETITSKGIEIIHTLKWFNAVSARLTDEQLNELRNLKFIKKIEPVKVHKSKKNETEKILQKSGATDPLNYGTALTQLNLSDIPPVHRKGITGKGVLLGILDSGFKWKTHEAISHANVLAEYDFIFKDSITANQSVDVSNQHNHGTSVFSVIAAKKDSVLIGAAFDAQFLLAKTEDIRSETMVEEDNYAAALEWMENYGADITTSSLGYSEFDNFEYTYRDMDGNSTIVTRAAELAFERGVLVITSAGNEGNLPWHYITAPADGINVIGVGAVNSNNVVASFSGRGPSFDGRIKPDIVAMGVNVAGASAIGNDTYGLYGGTSLAAPIAAGSAVLLLSAYPYLTNVQLRDIILRTAGNSEFPDNDRGYGLISAANAIEYPNLQQLDGTYVLNKIFLDDQVSNVKIHFSEDTINFIEENLTSDSIHYIFTLPPDYVNRVIRFYYTYSGEPGESVRVPSTGSFSVVYGDLTSIKLEDGSPVDFILSNNYPNPFNNSTRINFFVKELSDVELNIYDALGQKVKTLYSAQAVSGEFSLEWNGRSDTGLYCASGMYIYRLRTGGNELAKKMVLLK